MRNLNPCGRDLKIAVCSDERDLDNFAILENLGKIDIGNSALGAHF